MRIHWLLPRFWQSGNIPSMNEERIKAIRATAQRTLLIVELIEKDFSLSEVITYSKAKRQLCQYYYKQINPSAQADGEKK